MGDNKPDEANKPWMIRDVPDEVRRDVKIYAIQHGVTVAEALEALVKLALQLQLGLLPTPPMSSTSGAKPASEPEQGVPFASGTAASLLTQEDVMLVLETLAQVAQRIEARVRGEMQAEFDSRFKRELKEEELLSHATEIAENHEEFEALRAHINEQRAKDNLAPLSLEEVMGWVILFGSHTDAEDKHE